MILPQTWDTLHSAHRTLPFCYQPQTISYVCPACRSEVEQTTLSLGKKAENARQLLSHLYRRPFVTPNEVAQMLNITHQTASSLIRNFEKLDILKKWEKVGRNQGYVFDRYLALFLE